MNTRLAARFHSRLDEIDAGAWNALLPDDNPFVSHAFLAGLEQHGCLRTEYGWRANHLGLYAGDRLVAAAPLYLKRNSHGEYVFDWSWASAYERAGRDYYPKLLAAVPYSPVTGPRLLVHRDEDAATLRQLLINTIRAGVDGAELSSAHINFVTDADAQALADAGWLARFDWQFHWSNPTADHSHWRDFEDFLAALTHKKRKNIRHERAQVARAGITCELRHGDEIGAAEWRAVHQLYLNTFAERGNHPALTLAFFRHLGTAMPRHVLAVLCRRGTDIIAMALLLRSSTTLYGRYWGCVENVPGLHFEACYYQGIDYCLRHGLSRFEPGAQGEHKLARGFLPARTRSFHYLAEPRFRAAVREALMREAVALDEYHAELMAHSPYASCSTSARTSTGSLPTRAGEGAPPP
ncbi:MAG TPA: GNAT family N-acetyltransferase [Rudaea sp.]|nr:GNAT family N-acetyltransferase [Rudaea sp.]